MGRACSFAILFAFVSSCAAAAEPDEPIDIPLKEVWAREMPGTRDVKELEPGTFGGQNKSLPAEEQVALQRKSNVGRIRSALEWKDDAKPMPGFVVSGTGREALQAAQQVLTGESKRQSLLPADREVTAIFFSRRSGSYVHVHKVERQGNVIEVHYRFAPHDEAYGTEHFALIPLGKLPIRTYQVTFVQEPMEEKYLATGFKPKSAAHGERIVSRSFKFGVK